MKKIYICPNMDTLELSTADGLLAPISDTTVSGNNGGWAKGEVQTEPDDEGALWDFQWEE